MACVGGWNLCNSMSIPKDNFLLRWTRLSIFYFSRQIDGVERIGWQGWRRAIVPSCPSFPQFEIQFHPFRSQFLSIGRQSIGRDHSSFRSRSYCPSPHDEACRPPHFFVFFTSLKLNLPPPPPKTTKSTRKNKKQPIIPIECIWLFRALFYVLFSNVECGHLF